MSNRPKSNTPPIPRCIFCNGTGLSGEHLWPDWMGKYFPRTPQDVRVEVARHLDSRMNPLPGEHNVMHRRGHTVNKKIKVVCKRCNSGWMSIIENNAKPSFVRMMQGVPTLLTHETRQILAEWVFMKMCVFDSDKQVRSTIPAALKHAFFENRTIPNWTYIYFFQNLDPAWTAQLHRHASGFIKQGSDVDITSRNTQAFMIGVGGLLIYAFQCLLVELEPNIEENIRSDLWPLNGQSVQWPPFYALGPGQPDQLAEALGRSIKNWPQA